MLPSDRLRRPDAHLNMIAAWNRSNLHSKSVAATLCCMRPTQDPSSQWLRGVLDVCLLAVVEDQPAYGYEMTTRLRDHGLDSVADGSIYPALGRLEREGLLESYRVPSDGGPPRKYYKLTDLGRGHLVRNREHWKVFAGGVTKVLQLREGSREHSH